MLQMRKASSAYQQNFAKGGRPIGGVEAARRDRAAFPAAGGFIGEKARNNKAAVWHNEIS